MPDFEYGNQLWRLRATHGRDLIAESPGKLWDAACEYFEWCIENPIEEEDYQGGYKITRKHTPPFTIREFAVFMGACSSWWKAFKRSQGVLKNPDFLSVIDRIEDIMFTQKFRGAAVGMYKENLISRELGLRDNVNVDHTSNGETLSVLANMTMEELKKLRDGDEQEDSEEDLRSGD